MQTQALIFDMDGTMINSMPYHARSWVEFTRRHGIAAVTHYTELLNSDFLENLHAATS